MSYELQNDSGTLFKNNKKTDGDKLPDYTGNIKINGTEKRLAAWVKQGAKGAFLSLKISEPYEQKSSSQGNANSGDLPF
jgi:hypothetical protein